MAKVLANEIEKILARLCRPVGDQYYIFQLFRSHFIVTHRTHLTANIGKQIFKDDFENPMNTKE